MPRLSAASTPKPPRPRKPQAEQARAAAEQAKAEAERMKQEALAAAQEAARQKEEAEKAKADAIAQQQALAVETDKANAAAAQSESLRQQAEQDKADLRARLLQQLNSILATRDSARGLIANMSDVLFRSGSFELLPAARERLAKVSGIILAYPSLHVAIEGHTDSVGGDEYNQTLSERRPNRSATISCSREFRRRRLKPMASAKPRLSPATTPPKAVNKIAA